FLQTVLCSYDVFDVYSSEADCRLFPRCSRTSGFKSSLKHVQLKIHQDLEGPRSLTDGAKLNVTLRKASDFRRPFCTHFPRPQTRPIQLRSSHTALSETRLR